jgi:hypothetical protein
MNRNLAKLAFAGVALAASAGSMADIVTASTGNGELTLYVRDFAGSSPNSRVYARGLGIQIDSVLSSAVAGGSFSGNVQNFAWSLPGPIAADANLTAFLAGGTPSSQYVWTVMAGDTSLDNDGLAGDYRFFTTIQTNYVTNPSSIPNGSALGSSWNGIDAFETAVNSALPNSPGSSTGVNGNWGQNGSVTGSSADTWFGAGTNNANALGSAARVYVVANASDAFSSERSRAFQAVDLRLTAAGTLESVTSSVVPLPPAIWLLGSALVGLTGVARRRNVVPAVA